MCGAWAIVGWLLWKRAGGFPSPTNSSVIGGRATDKSSQMRILRLQFALYLPAWALL